MRDSPPLAEVSRCKAAGTESLPMSELKTGYTHNGRIFLFVLGLAGVFIVVPANAGQKIAPLVTDGKTASLAGEIWHRTYDPKLNLALKDNDLDKNSILGVVRAKYVLGRRGQVGRIVHLYYKGDGSQAEILSAPDRFKGLQAVDYLSALFESRWGSLQMVGLQITTKGKTFPWREDGLCISTGCWLTTYFEHVSSKGQIFEAVQTNLLEKPYRKILADSASEERLIRHLVSRGKTFTLLPERARTDQKGQVPLKLHVLPRTINRTIHLKRGINKINLNDPLSGSLLQFLSRLHKLENTVQSQDHVAINEIIRQFEPNYKEGRLCSLYKYHASGRSVQRVKTTAFGLYQAVKSWESLRLLSVFESAQYAFVVIQPKGQGQTEWPVQVFALAKSSEKYVPVIFGDVTDYGWHVIRQEDFVDFLSNEYFVKSR